MKAFGIVLLILAALILLQGHFGIPSFGGQIWPLLGIAFFAYQSVGTLLRRHLTSASFTALVALMIANHFYDILPIPNQSLFWASILIVLGVNALTHSNRTWNGKKWWYDGEKTILTDKEVAFGTGTFYKQNQELVEDQVEVGFGNAKDILRQCRDFRRYCNPESRKLVLEMQLSLFPNIGELI